MRFYVCGQCEKQHQIYESDGKPIEPMTRDGKVFCSDCWQQLLSAEQAEKHRRLERELNIRSIVLHLVGPMARGYTLERGLDRGQLVKQAFILADDILKTSELRVQAIEKEGSPGPHKCGYCGGSLSADGGWYCPHCGGC